MQDQLFCLEIALYVMTYQTQEKSPCGTYFNSAMEARAAEVHNWAEENTLGLSGLEFRPWMA